MSRLPRNAVLTALLALGIAAGAAPARAQPLPPAVAAALGNAGIPPAGAALYVRDVTQPAPLLAHNADAVVNPASLMKLVTTLAALETLGPAYTWKTEVYATGEVSGGVLAGDLVIKGYGDPKLTIERFWLLLRDIQARGIRTVRGDVVLDRSHFLVPPADPGAFDGEPYRPYNALPDALLLNFNAVRVSFVPEPSHSKVRVFAEPHPGAIFIENRLSLAAGPCRDLEPRYLAQVDTDWSRARIAFSGAYPADCGEKTENFSVLASPSFFADAFRQLWAELGGTIEGQVRDGVLPPDARRIAEADSPPLADVIRDINKFSNNVMARQLLLTLGAYGFGPPGTADSGARAVRVWLAQNGLDFPELVLENGSGLSRAERISARHLGELLVRAYRGPTMPEYMASLPVAGIDGTLKRRMRGAASNGQAHLKTGYLEGVRAIAGYVLDRNGRRVAVVLVINHPNARQAGAVPGAVVDWVYESAGTRAAAKPP
ncbi:MAG: D-alanyl-D-alanine carboxypeptidase/D-alanyl-D-alanine endopeptidase [Pseudomonadota bacterium]